MNPYQEARNRIESIRKFMWLNPTTPYKKELKHVLDLMEFRIGRSVYRGKYRKPLLVR